MGGIFQEVEEGTCADKWRVLDIISMYQMYKYWKIWDLENTSVGEIINAGLLLWYLI